MNWLLINEKICHPLQKDEKETNVETWAFDILFQSLYETESIDKAIDDIFFDLHTYIFIYSRIAKL